MKSPRLEQQQGKVEVIAPEKAPVKEVVLTGDKADLRVLPMPMHQKGDAGPYHTMTCAMKGLNAGLLRHHFHQE